jgi:hypothetical protein
MKLNESNLSDAKISRQFVYDEKLSRPRLAKLLGNEIEIMSSKIQDIEVDLDGFELLEITAGKVLLIEAEESLLRYGKRKNSFWLENLDSLSPP